MNNTHENVIIWSAIAFVIAACFVSLAILFTLAIKGMSPQRCPQPVPAVQTNLLTPIPSDLWKTNP